MLKTDTMNIETKFIRNIIAANNDNSLAIFVGAGISKSSETKSFKLPNWNDLIEELKKELDVNSESDYLKIAQLYFLAFGEFTYYKKLKEYFPDYITPSLIHKQIFEINPHVIITTNWDNILERAIEENAYIYDLVCSDKDLVKSTLQNKLIKMHGDFKNHNIVFKEDDYINYQYKFPLIENYVKSIISTHTVVFLGYSYNDINLKQIINWVQNYSSVRPPMYLITFKQNLNQIKYLENHGITTIVLSDKKNDIISSNDMDDFSKELFIFLDRIKSNDESNIIDSADETISFILNKLETLNELDGILIEQIQHALSNCGFVFDSDSMPILEFYNGDYNKSTRNIYSEFIEILRKIDNGEKPSPQTLKIFEILSKARIKGVVISKDDASNISKEYLPFSNYLKYNVSQNQNLYYDINFTNLTKSSSDVSELFELAFKFYNLDKLEEAFALIEDAITICLKRRNYTWLFIAMFNRNILLRRLKYSFNPNVDNDKYLKYDEYNLKERYHNLTKDLKFALEPIYEFIDFTFIYRYAYNISEELKNTEDAKRTIENGGMVLHSDIYKFSSKHENLVSFVLKNKIMIENFNEYKTINKTFVRIALIRQIQKKAITLTKTELYTCIKYIDYKELKFILDDFYNKESDNKGKFQLVSEVKNWIINTVFRNITSQYLSSNSPFNSFERCIENILFILSLTKHNEDEVDKILNLINDIVKVGSNTLGIFQSINLFLGIQYNLYKLEIKEQFLIDMIENLINKIVYKKFNGHEYHALTRNELSNLYGYARQRKAVIKNESLIGKLLQEVKSYSTSDKIEMTQNFILNIYDISNKKLKSKIKDFILLINSKEENELYKKIVFDLTLIIYEFNSISKENIMELEDYLKQYESGKTFSSALYMLDSQVEYLIKNKKTAGLEKISDILKSSITRHEQSDRIAIF
jgi:hypothetical protein